MPPPKGERAEARGLPAGGTLSEGGAAAVKERWGWAVGRVDVERGILVVVLHRLRRREGHMRLEGLVEGVGWVGRLKNKCSCGLERKTLCL